MRGSPRVVGAGRIASRWLAGVSALCIAAWALPALLMLDKGFSLRDEGTYVLSYRWWSSNPYRVPSSQYLYGPLFQALGESIPLLRLARLVMVLVANAGFATCLVVWLERRSPQGLPAGRLSLVLLLTAGGGLSYLWAPLSPGYYDLTADLSLALVALTLLALVGSPHPGAWILVAAGAGSVLLAVAKWTAFPVALFAVGVLLWSVARGGGRAPLTRSVALLVGGGVLALLAVQVFLVPLGELASVTRHLTALTATGNHSLGYLARTNLSTTLSSLGGALLVAWPLAVGLAVSTRLARQGRHLAGRRWLVGAALLTLVLPFVFGWHGGSDRGRVVFAVVLGGLAVAVVASVSGGRDARRDTEVRVVAVLLFAVPLVQAAGTNVPIAYVAGECLAMWMAIPLILVTASERPLAPYAVLVDLVVVVAATAMVAGTTTLLNPFDTSAFARDTVLVPHLGLRVAPATARQYDALSTALEPYVVPGRTPVFTLDRNAGLTYLLGGVPVGSTWTDAASPARTAGILALACGRGDRPDALPVLLLDRAVDPALRAAMAGCGIAYPADYRLLPVPGGPPGLRVLVPRTS